MGFEAAGLICQVPSTPTCKLPVLVTVPFADCWSWVRSRTSPQFGVRVWIVSWPGPVLSAHIETLAELMYCTKWIAIVSTVSQVVTDLCSGNLLAPLPRASVATSPGAQVPPNETTAEFHRPPTRLR